ncbi:MAG TPA: ATP-binding protein [Burkholderiales bacterium]|nr:ATP-binding protein [Burkholderiales bacterium]
MYNPSQAQGRRRVDHKLIWFIGVSLIAIMAAFQVHDILKRREIVIDTTEDAYASLARSLAEQSQRIVQAAGLAVSDTAGDAASTPPVTAAFQKRLRQRVSVLPQLQGIAVLAEDGALQAYAGAPWRLDELGQISTTSGGAQSPRGAAFSLPFRRSDGRWTVALSQAIRRPPGGIVVALLDLDYFSRVYASLRLEPGSEVSLFHRNGQLLARYPGDGGEIGRSFADHSAYGDLLSTTGTGTVVRHGERDGQDITYAIQPLPGFPLVIAAAVDNGTVLRPWNIQAMHSTVRTSLFCLSVLLLLALVLRLLRRREQAEESLRVQTALLDELFESAPEAIVMLDTQQRVARVNREFSRLFGLTAHQALGRELIDLIVPDDLKEEARRAAAAVREGRHMSAETRRMRADGGRLHVSELGAPIRGAGGGIASFAIYRDITERKLAEAERAKLESRLRQAEKLEAIGTMAGGIAHDFNSTLMVIVRYAEMLRSAAPEGGTIKGFVNNVLSAASRAQTLVNQILTYSRTTRGKQDAVNACSALQETLDLMRATLPANVKMEVQLPTSSATIFANTTQLHQLVTNLCSNAIQAMREGGTLSVALETVDTAADTELSHGLLAAGRYVRLSVQDTGSGMPPVVLDHIFEPFFTTKEMGQGTGLGLALVQGIVSELGGAIDVTSQTGAGSSFHIYLPRSDADALGTKRTVETLSKGAGQRVLLVEDEKPLMLLAEEMLATLGYEPAGFARPSEALEEFRADPSRWDAVLVDYLMPDLGGLEVARRLRDARSGIPIVLMSGYEGPVLLQEAFTAGIDDVITKPLDLQHLADALAKALGQVSAR